MFRRSTVPPYLSQPLLLGWVLALCMSVASSDVFAQQRVAGRDIAAACTNCHGSDGHSRGVIPSLAGHDAKEIARAMQEFRDGRRPSTLMQQLARGYTDAQIDAAAAYFAMQKRDP